MPDSKHPTKGTTMSDEQNKPGFTPGPWRWCEGWNQLPYAIDPDDESVGPKYADLALMGGDTQIIPLGVDHYDYIFDARGVYANVISEADRNLIAAAPDLYEKLEKFKDWMIRLADQHEKIAELYKGRFGHLADECRVDAKNYRATAKDIEKTLAKARGEVQP